MFLSSHFHPRIHSRSKGKFSGQLMIFIGVPQKAQLSFRLFVNFFVYWAVLRNSTKILYALKGI